ncbi:hypothetical protein DPMN_164540 [Dreissena polymorpha]|uniref:Uncharacterized protein n=1 Tax=Dreissena polymorpha TaxID=45954 RepID=A0A9D4EW32_DREPO|nr:hypothetical protein DPMN_164540 [Dreissena polymorpha]
MQRFQACRLLTLRRRLLECNRILGEIAHILVHTFNEPMNMTTSHVSHSRHNDTGRSTSGELFAIHAHAQQLLLQTKLIGDFSYYSFDQSNISNLLRMLSKELRKIICSVVFVLRSGETMVQKPGHYVASGVPCNASVDISYDPDYINILADNVEKYFALFNQSVAGLNSLLEIDQEE